MDLILDVGNTNIVIGVFKNDELLNYWRYSTANVTTSDVFGLFLNDLLKRWGIDYNSIKKTIISSVVPNIMHSLENSIIKYFDMYPTIASCEMPSKVSLKSFENPNNLGIDRYVNCIGAFESYGGNIIVIDFGTATTYDVLDKYGRFVTGITSPGIKISADALSSKAALLESFKIVKPDSILPKNTLESLQAGLVYGQIGQTEYIVSKLKEELNAPNMRVVFTGGLSSIISGGTNVCDFIDTELTLKGIRTLLYYKK